MNYFKQIYYEMKHQKMMTWVSVSGTALAIFLVMAFVMVEQVRTVEAAPESRRSRIVYGGGLDAANSVGWSVSTSGISYQLAQEMYGNLEGLELISYVPGFTGNMDVCVRNGEIFSMIPRVSDATFWKIFDFTFIDGRPFDKAEADAGAKVAVLTRSSARRLFGDEKVSGRTVEVDKIKYRVVGVVEDTNPVLVSSYANIYLPYNPAADKQGDNFIKGQDKPYLGGVSTIILMKDGTDVKSMKEQVRSHFAKINKKLAPDGYSVVWHQQPLDAKEMSIGGLGGNYDPETKEHDRNHYLVLALLIILPAINLGSMTRSRLRRRTSEIGVRRAFGAKRLSIVGQLFCENLIMTVIGGMIGLLFSILFLLLFANMAFALVDRYNNSLELLDARPDIRMLFNWATFGYALAVCFILNLLSATLPAWLASRVTPADAISKAG